MSDYEDEYIWRFAVEGRGGGEPLYQDPLIEFLREQLCILLDVVGLYQGDRRVHVDRFCLLNDEARTFSIYEDGINASAADQSA